MTRIRGGKSYTSYLEVDDKGHCQEYAQIPYDAPEIAPLRAKAEGATKSTLTKLAQTATKRRLAENWDNPEPA